VIGHVAISVRSGHDPVAVDADVIMTGAVGLAGIGYAWWNRWVSMLHDRTLSDLAAVRDVIEEGAIYLHRVSYAFDRAQREMNDDVERAHAALVEIGPTYDEIAERLKVRLEPHHEVAQKFAGAVEAGLDAARAIERLAVLHLPSIAMGGAAAKQATVLADKDRDVLAQARSRFDAHRSEYLDAAARTAGAKLPSR
jgi:hypothetical protein